MLKLLLEKIDYSISKLELNLSDKIVLTEAATGNYMCTAIIADKAGAKRVYALAKDSIYGTIDDIKREYKEYFLLNRDSNIVIIDSLDEIKEKVDIITNSGFIRPINEEVLKYTHKNSVITLMYEPWEFREGDIDLELVYKKGLKVYGVNEHNEKLRIMDYIGITVLYLLLDLKISHFSNREILVLGTYDFTEPIERTLKKNGYKVTMINDYKESIDINRYDIFVVAEHQRDREVIGNSKDAFIKTSDILDDKVVIHISGNVDFNGASFLHLPSKPAPFGYMSYRTDFIDNMAVIDLQTGSLKVAEGMLEANRLNLKGREYKDFVEQNYYGLAFSDEKYW